jgi:hypothetical protein
MSLLSRLYRLMFRPVAKQINAVCGYCGCSTTVECWGGFWECSSCGRNPASFVVLNDLKNKNRLAFVDASCVRLNLTRDELHDYLLALRREHEPRAQPDSSTAQPQPLPVPEVRQRREEEPVCSRG